MEHASIESIIANSFKDFHAKGLDYICLVRTPQLTRKVYFLNGDVTKVPEVVNPHDHRYAFQTRVLAGAMLDHTYSPTCGEMGDVYQKFDYRTPLNGGNGFTYVEEVKLFKRSSEKAERGQRLWRDADTIHTIQMLQDQTVLLLDQFEDTVPIDQPTQTFVRKGYPEPSLDGLYTKFTADEVVQRLAIIRRLMEAKR